MSQNILTSVYLIHYGSKPFESVAVDYKVYSSLSDCETKLIEIGYFRKTGYFENNSYQRLPYVYIQKMKIVYPEV